MTPKKLDTEYKYAKYDNNKDGNVRDKEINRPQELIEPQTRDEKSEQHKQMAELTKADLTIDTH